MHIKKMFTQSTQYFTGQAIAMLAGFISFPIFTRLFSVEEFGIINLVSSTILFMVAFAKFGIQNATVRYYEEYKTGKRPGGLAEFYSTLLIGSLCIGGALTVLLWLGLQGYGLFSHGSQLFVRLLSFTAILIFIRNTMSIITNFMRAEQATQQYNIMNIVLKYGGTALSIFLMVYVIRGLYGFYTGMIVVEGVILAYLLHRVITRHGVALRKVSMSFLREAIHYGLPLIVFEFAAIIMAYADRYLIQIYLGSDAVGLYSAGYNLSEFVATMLIVPIQLAITPIYMNIWATRTPEDVKQFLSQTLTYYALLAIPVVVGFSSVGKDAVIVLASAKYFEAYRVIPLVIGGWIMYGAYNILASGLFIHKKTSLLGTLIVAAGTLNVVLNIWFIPKWGIQGSALATLIAYSFFTISITLYSFKYLAFKIDYGAMMRFSLYAMGMLAVIVSIHLRSPLLDLMARSLSGALVYGIIIVLFEKDIREKLIEWYQRMVGAKKTVPAAMAEEGGKA